MFEVVMQFEDGSDCAVAPVETLADAALEAMDMYAHGHCAVLRKNGVAVNKWIGTGWQNPM